MYVCEVMPSISWLTEFSFLSVPCVRHVVYLYLIIGDYAYIHSCAAAVVVYVCLLHVHYSG